MTIRRAEPGDARGIAEAHVSSWRSSYRGIVPDARLEALDAESRVPFWETHLETTELPNCGFVTLDDHGVIKITTNTTRNFARELYFPLNQ